MGSVFAIGSVFAASSFTDIKGNERYAASVEELRAAGVIKGYADGSYGPEKTISRAEFVKIVAGVIVTQADMNDCIARAKEGNNTPEKRFRDVEPGAWYSPPLCVALEIGLIAGYSDGTFRPAATINAAEVGKILTKAFQLQNDERAGDAWYDPYLRALKTNNAFPPTIHGADEKVTRGEMAEMLATLAYHRQMGGQSSDQQQPTFNGTDEIFTLTNSERLKAGLKPLTWNETLAKAAQDHAEDMQKRNFYSHDNPDGEGTLDRIKKTKYLTIDMATCNCKSWSYRFGENINKGDTPAHVMESWMASPTHRENILMTDYEEIGAGHAGEYWVQVFGRVTMK
jgi:uncharacterized protein YkwD